jgi:hypothetical protein
MRADATDLETAFTKVGSYHMSLDSATCTYVSFVGCASCGFAGIRWVTGPQRRLLRLKLETTDSLCDNPKSKMVRSDTKSSDSSQNEHSTHRPSSTE